MLTRIAATLLILPLIGAALSNPYSPQSSGGIDWSGAHIRQNQRYIEANAYRWRHDNLSFGLYGMSVALGVTIFALAVAKESDDRNVVSGAVASAFLIWIGAASWMYVCVNRFTLPPSIVAQNLGIATWTTPAMDIPFVAGAILLGLVIWQQYSRWGGGFIIALDVALVTVARRSFGDIPPWMHFLVFLLAGFTLLSVGNGRQRKNDVQTASDFRLNP